MRTRCLGCMEEYDDACGLCPNCGYEPDTDVDSPIHMQPGVVLHGRYLIGKVLGFGGFGVTYIGWDFTLQQKVAIKEYLPSEFATRMIGQTQVTVFGGKKEEQFDDGMEKFVEEAKRLAQFQNEEGIVRIFDSFAENNTAYIVMEYLEGETLAAYLDRNGKVPIDEAIQMLTPVLESLETVHKAGIIHRDIAPDNIYLTKDGRVKLIDFGAARYATTSHSRSLTVIIKPGYSPEEQYRSQGDQGPHTDVYALGAVLYRMVTGIVLPDSMERRACFEKNGKDIVVPVSKNCKLSKNQENAIMNALNVRVEDRTPTVAKFQEELTAKRPVRRIVGRIKALDLMRWPLWARILLPVAGAAILTLIILLFTGVIGPRGNLITDIVLGDNEARVPSVVNYSVDVAQDRLAAQGLECQITGTEYSDVIPANVVLYQSIVAGQVVEKNTVVEVCISTDQGGTSVEEGVMPGVTYKTEPEAVALLESIGLTVKVEYVYSDIVAEGMVVDQSIEAGTDIRNGGTVTLEVSQGVDPDKEEASSEVVTLTKETYDLYVGDSVTLQAEGGNGSYSYESSDEDVAIVGRDGKLTAVGTGTAKITVRSGEAKEASCTVTVQDYQMTLTPNSLTLFANATTNLSVSGIPGNVEISWSSGNSKIASVNSSGKVTGVSTGKTTITATWKNGKNTYSASAAVTVEAGGITLSTYKISSFYVGETRTITANTSSGQAVQWSSSNTGVAKVNSSGVVTAVGGGNATITARCGSYSESCSVTVTQPSISLTKSSVSLYTGDSTTLSATVVPGGTSVSWSSDNSGVANVSGGSVTAVDADSTTIRARMTYANKTYEASCTVSVTQPGITLSASSLSMIPGESKTLTASTTPSGSSVSWSSANSGVAKVSGGTVTAVADGTTQVTAQMTYNGKTYNAVCNVTVAKPSISITASTDTIEYSEIDNGTCTLTANVNPDGGSVKWESSAPSVASVSGDGKTATVTALAEGSATIKATYSVNGTTVSSQCTVTVRKAASTLQLTDFWYTESGTVDSFQVYGTISSNYALTRVTCLGSATSNALGIKVKDSAEPYYFADGTYTVDASVLRDYFINQYRKLYELYAAVAGLLGADNSVTMNISSTCYDASGNSITFTFNYVLYSD